METSKLAIDMLVGETFYIGDKNEVPYKVLDNFGIVMHNDNVKKPRQMVALLIKSNYSAVHHFELDEELKLVSKKNKG